MEVAVSDMALDTSVEAELGRMLLAQRYGDVSVPYRIVRVAPEEKHIWDGVRWHESDLHITSPSFLRASRE